MVKKETKKKKTSRPRLTKEMAFSVWKLQDDEGKNIEDTADIINEDPANKSKNLHIDESTVKRLRYVRRLIEGRVPTSEMVKRLGKAWTDQISKCRVWLREYELRTSWIQDDVKQIVNKFRNRVIYPLYENEQALPGESLWYYESKDWRLTPNVWLRLMIPDLKTGPKWPARYEKLKQYEISESFCQHYEELEQMVQDLDTDLSQAAEQVAEKNSTFGDIWKKLNQDLPQYFKVHIKPSRETKLSPADIEALPYPDDEFVDMALSDFETTIPDLKVRYQLIEQKLRQVCDDLDNMVE